MEASDAQVEALREKLVGAVQQKRVVLGEVSAMELVKDQTGIGGEGHRRDGEEAG